MRRSTNVRGARVAALTAACAIGFGLAGCGSDEAAPSAATPSTVTASAPNGSESASATSSVAVSPETVPAMPTPNAEPPISAATIETLVASLPENDIYLYGVDPEGV